MNKENPLLLVEDEDVTRIDDLSNFSKLLSRDSNETQTDLLIKNENAEVKVLDLESKFVLDPEIEKIKKELDQMSPLHLPQRYIDFPRTFSTVNVPESYIKNSSTELKCIDYTNNFIRQYKHIYKDRKPLLLLPYNENKTQKYICTFIRPTELKYSELYYWDTAAKFVSDYLDFVPVVPSTEVPTRILSSSMVLYLRKGTCFEYSLLLCSLLLGVGYDAYVVSGYASRECCYIDQSRSPCPFLDESYPASEKVKDERQTKYIVRPPKDLKSKFELYQEARKCQKEVIEKENLRIKQEEENKIKEKPPPDPLFGLRVHCWILVKANSRDIAEDFFIEPLTGHYVPLKTDMFTGIESIWNNINYWVNMQDCSKGINDMSYDLRDRYFWEFVLPTQSVVDEVENEAYQQSYSKIIDKDIDDEVNSIEHLSNVFETPSSWIKRLTIDLEEFEKRFPAHEKQIRYYKTKCIRYSPYYNTNGLIMKLLLYTDNCLTELIEEREFFEQRIDKLHLIIKKDGWTIEHFLKGSNFNIKEHHYRTDYPQPESERKFIFYHKGNVDGLVKKEETASSLTEYYIDRPDHLIYMDCTFTKRVVSFAKDKGVYRNIEKIVKRFSRDYSKPSNEDVAEMILFLNEERFFITYHVDEFNLIPDTREYFKPAIPQDGKNIVPFYNDTHYHFRVNSYCKKGDSKLKIYQYLLELFKEEKKSKDTVRWSENHTKDILNQRKIEMKLNSLSITLYDTIRNTLATKQRIEIEDSAEMERNKRVEDELDYLTPFLYNQNINEIQTKEEAYKIREECLMDFKQSLIYKANIIQQRYEDETAKLQKQQQWYYQNQAELMKEDEDKYIEFCTKSAFTINNLEIMLNRHKQIAPRKYVELERKIRNDDRMKKFLNAV